MSPSPTVGRSPARPVVLVPACNRLIGDHAFSVAGAKYLDAVRLAGCTPLVVPDVAPEDLPALLELADGVLLTGSKSNVHPRHFGEPVHDPQLPLDPGRDDWTLALVPLAVARGLPLFAICRGAQEANVAFGGTLHQAVQEVGPYSDHRAPEGQPAALQYAPAHLVDVVPGGLLARLLNQPRFEVNSLHGQAVNRLAPGLRVEAKAPDGLVEAFSVDHARGFALCVQWHPEWQATANPVSTRLLEAFGQACREWRDRKHAATGAVAAGQVGSDGAAARGALPLSNLQNPRIEAH